LATLRDRSEVSNEGRDQADAWTVAISAVGKALATRRPVMIQ
jgi:hypothetical protein